MIVARYALNIGIFSKKSFTLRAIQIRTLATMKRKAQDHSLPKAKIKKQSEPQQDYCDAEPRRADDGSILWPADPKAIEDAQEFLRQW